MDCCCARELFPCCSNYEHPHMALSPASSFQAKKPFLRQTGCLCLGRKMVGCPLCGRLASDHVLALWCSCPAFASSSRSLSGGKVTWEKNEACELMGADRDGCLQEYAIAYCEKEAEPMATNVPCSLVSRVFANRKCLEHLGFPPCRIHIKFVEACTLILWYSCKRKELGRNLL